MPTLSADNPITLQMGAVPSWRTWLRAVVTTRIYFPGPVNFQLRLAGGWLTVPLF